MPGKFTLFLRYNSQFIVLFAQPKCTHRHPALKWGRKRSALHRSSQRIAHGIAPRCTSHRTALHQPSHRTAPDGAKRKAGLHCGIRPGCECYARGCLPHILGLAGIVIHLLGAPLHVVHIELLLVGIQHALEAHVVCLVGVKGLPHDDVAAAAGVVACRE